MKKSVFIIYTIYLAASGVILSLIPPVEQLGDKVRLIIFHGILSISGLTTIYAAGLLALVHLLLHLIQAVRKPRSKTGFLRHQDLFGQWSGVIGSYSVAVWLAGTLLSLAAMQIAWGGLMWHEPRTVAALTMVVLGLGKEYLIRGKDAATASAGNVSFAGAVLLIRWTLEFVMHPENPIGRSDSRAIKLLPMLLLMITLAAVIELSRRTLRARSGVSAAR